MEIKEWVKGDMPRKKLHRNNPSVLTDTELIAILLRNGTREKNALDLAKDVLRLGRNNLRHLGKVTAHEIMKIRGMGEVKTDTLLAALELGRRRQAALSLDKPVVKESKDIANYLRALLQDLSHEVFAVVFLNRANRINHIEIVSKGGLTNIVVDPRVILRKALEQEAINLILCHNHPSGNLQPSQDDKNLTLKIKQAAQYLYISIFDHIIVSETGYFSFADNELL